MKNVLENTGNRANMKDRMNELKDRNLEMIQVEEERELRSKKQRNSIGIIQILVGRAILG